MSAPAMATPGSETRCPPTTQHSLPSGSVMTCGMPSPHFCLDMRDVQTSGCSCTWSSALIRPYFSSMEFCPFIGVSKFKSADKGAWRCQTKVFLDPPLALPRGNAPRHPKKLDRSK